MCKHDEHHIDTLCYVFQVFSILPFISSKDYVKRVNESISEYRTYDIDHYNSSYIVQDHGTTHISIIGPDGMAVSVTTYALYCMYDV